MQIDFKFIEMEKEVWKDVVGYEGLYMVSSMGRVKSLEREANIRNGGIRTCSERILKQTNKNGYKQVSLCKDSHMYTYLVHRLEMLAFVGERPEGMDVDHINSIRTDNRLENLRYVSRKENINNPNSNIIRPISQYTLQGEHIRNWKSAREVEEVLGFSNQSIGQCCKVIKKSAHGFQWRYLNSDGSYPIVKETTGIRGNKKKAISQYTLQGELIRNWKSAMEINKQLGYDNSLIGKCCKGKQITAYGYQWRYV